LLICKYVRNLFFSLNGFLLNRNDGNEVGGSVYQRLNSRLETGVQVAWTPGTNQTRFALASKYQLDSYTAIGAKVNNNCQVGLSFQQLVRPGIQSLFFSKYKISIK
jgi:voltage-dependent anion channel protein 2